MDDRGSTYVSDRELLLRLTESDADAFATLFSRWRPRLVSFFRHRRLQADDAEDLADGCLEVVWRRRTSFVATVAPGSAWIFGIARRELARHWRQKANEARTTNRLSVLIDLTDDGAFESIEDRIDAAMVTAQLSVGLQALPPAERSAIVLRILEQRTYPEIARLLECSEPAARQRVSRGLQHLRSTLSADPH